MALYGLWDDFNNGRLPGQAAPGGVVDSWLESVGNSIGQFFYPNSKTVPPNPPPIHLAAPQTEAQMTNSNLWNPLITAQQTRVNYIDEVNRNIPDPKDNTMWWLIGGAVVAVALIAGSSKGMNLSISLPGGGGRRRR